VSKSALRALVREARRTVPEGQRSAEAAAAIAILQPVLESACFASYMAARGELDLAELHRWAWASGRTVLLPRVLPGSALAWSAPCGPQQLRVGAFGISEPDPGLVGDQDLPPRAIVLVPGVAFDCQGHRLGQGGGYYDRLLAQRTDLIAIGVGFSCQLVEAVPCEPHDRPMAGLVIAGALVRDPRT